MNVANMIDNDNLKKGFIMATLISTVVGTFTTSLGLYERVRDQHRQHKTDHGQNARIQALERRAEAGDGQAEHAEHADASHADPYDALAASGPLIRRAYDRSCARLGPRFAAGDPTAQNELQAQIIDLQASVIGQLQDALATGTVPDPAVLYAAAGRARDGSLRALQNQHRRMLAAAPAPGGGSVGSGGGQRRLRALSVAAAADPPRTRPRSRSHAAAGGRCGPAFPGPDRALPLFCSYAVQLQAEGRRRQRRRQAGANGDSDEAGDRDSDGDVGSHRGVVVCPACRGRIPIEHDRAWTMVKPVVVGERVVEAAAGHDGRRDDADDGGSSTAAWAAGPLVLHDGGRGGRHAPDSSSSVSSSSGSRGTALVHVVELVQERHFVLSNRFIVKCHRPAGLDDDGDGALRPPAYACSLCDRFDAAGRVALCSTMARLVSHVCERHSVGELLSDPDIRERRGPSSRRTEEAA